MAAFDAPLEPTRVKSFAQFFKNYMSVSSVVAALTPNVPCGVV